MRSVVMAAIALLPGCHRVFELSEVKYEAPDASVDERCEAGSLRVFATSVVYAADFGVAGLSGADDRCTQQATQAMLGGTWKAWVSSSTENAIDRISGTGPWCLVDQSAPVFAARDDLASVPLTPINMFEDGQRHQNGQESGVWTGTLIGGTAATEHCIGWTTTVTGMGTLGRVYAANEQWTSHQLVGCGQAPGLRLYCFEQ